MRCQECGLLADEQAIGWRAYRTDLAGEEPDDEPTIVFYCLRCAVREFGPILPSQRRDE